MNDEKKIDLKCLYQKSPKTSSKSKAEIFEDFLRETAINRNHADIDKLKERLRFKPLLLEKAMTTKNGWKKKKKKIHYGRKAAKTLNLYKIQKEDQKYEKFLPLHHLWTSYIQNVFSDKNGDVNIKADERILKVDLHGAKISVVDCKCKSFIGLNGIVVKETKNMIEIITESDAMKRIPKKETLFVICAHGHKITIYGNGIVARPGERIAKNLKTGFNSAMILGDIF